MSNQGYYGGQQPQYPPNSYGAPQGQYQQGPPPGQYYQQGPPPQMQYQQQGPPPKQSGGGQGCIGACLAALCCCFVVDETCECCVDCAECCF